MPGRLSPEPEEQSSAGPDVFKSRQTPQLRDAERPEHYLDYELLEGDELPKTRCGFISTCRRKGLDPIVHSPFQRILALEVPI